MVHKSITFGCETKYLSNAFFAPYSPVSKPGLLLAAEHDARRSEGIEDWGTLQSSQTSP
jgi:hypothetical protein